MAVAAVLDLDEAARAAARPAWRRGARSRASTSCSRSTHAPSVAAIASATSSAVPDERRDGGIDRRELRACRLTAQPPTNTWRALCSERRTDWRDFASASPVMQQVLMTCSSACSATSSWPAASSARRASIASACETLQPRNLTAKRILLERTFRAAARACVPSGRPREPACAQAATTQAGPAQAAPRERRPPLAPRVGLFERAPPGGSAWPPARARR